MKRVTAFIRDRLSPEQASHVERQVEDWLRHHPLAQEGWYYVKLSSGPDYIAVSPLIDFSQ
jgi:hypothetical protein